MILELASDEILVYKRNINHWFHDVNLTCHKYFIPYFSLDPKSSPTKLIYMIFVKIEVIYLLNIRNEACFNSIGAKFPKPNGRKYECMVISNFPHNILNRWWDGFIKIFTNFLLVTFHFINSFTFSLIHLERNYLYAKLYSDIASNSLPKCNALSLYESLTIPTINATWIVKSL